MAWNHTVRRFLRGSTGQGTVEYAFLLLAIALAVFGALGTLATATNQMYMDINSKIAW